MDVGVALLYSPYCTKKVTQLWWIFATVTGFSGVVTWSQNVFGWRQIVILVVALYTYWEFKIQLVPRTLHTVQVEQAHWCPQCEGGGVRAESHTHPVGEWQGALLWEQRVRTARTRPGFH